MDGQLRYIKKQQRQNIKNKKDCNVEKNLKKANSKCQIKPSDILPVLFKR
jgi:hypothetical protein